MTGALAYFNGDDLAADVWKGKYALHDNEGKQIEHSPAETHRRLAREFARIEAKKFKKPLTEDEIFSYLDGFRRIVPQGSPMFGIGNPYAYVSVSNCFVLSSPSDSYGGIFETDQQIAQISKRRGGVGYDISNLRPKDMAVKNAARTTSGAVSFMERFSNTGREVGQFGRRGAQMISMSVHHPDIEDFAKIKMDPAKVTGANVAIRLTDEFMLAAEKNDKYEQRWPVDSDRPSIRRLVDARKVWQTIIWCAWKRAEPGLLFWDNILRESPADCYAKFGFGSTSTNPCVPGWAVVLTPTGEKTIDQIKGGEKVWSEDGWVNVLNKWSTGENAVYRYDIGDKHFYCTVNHQVTASGVKTPIGLTAWVDVFVGPSNVKAPVRISGNQFVCETETFDLVVDGPSHTYWCQGINSANCGEIILCPFDSCRLLLLNLFGYIVNPFHADAYFDFAKFYQDAKIAQRLMDDLVDLEVECIDRILQKIDSDIEPDHVKDCEKRLWQNIREACVKGRRTGTGQTGLGDVMAALGVKYGSDESVQLTEQIYRTLKFACYQASVDMAKELGPFPVWDHELEKANAFLGRLKKETLELNGHVDLPEVVLHTDEGTSVLNGHDLWSEIKKYGRRNIALLTTAPAGTVSTLTQTTSGIEPLFMMSYTRRRKVSEKAGKVDFVDHLGDRWEEYEVFHPKLKLWMEVTGEKDPKKSPYFGCCAEDLDWTQRVKLQAAAQKNVDHSISSTLNLPEDVSVEKVAEIYERAWKEGLKGVTVYRKNCRTGVLVDKASQRCSPRDAPKRPQDLPCEIHHTRSQGKDYFVVLGLYEGAPYEVFAGQINPYGCGLPKKIKSGVVRKMKRGTYNLLDEHGKVLFRDITKGTDDHEETLTRLLSTSLRHGTPVEYILHQLDKVKGDIGGFAKVIGRTLKHYVKDGTRVTGESCPQCGSENLCRQEGCASCQNCQWSKCS